MNRKLIRNKIKNLFKESLGFPKVLPLPKEACREEKLKGGLADNKTASDLAKKHKVPVGDIVSQVEKGKDVEAEHSSDPAEQKEIAKDHVDERPDYYDALDAAGIEEEVLNEMPYFFLKDKQGNDLPHLDVQMEKWNSEKEFLDFLVHIFSGQPYQDEKQPLFQTDNPNEFYKVLMDINLNKPHNPANQLLVLFTRRFVPGKEKATFKSITPEDIQHYIKTIQIAVGKASELR